MPRILYLHGNKPCYLAESLFHGLRTVLGANCVDVPRYDSLYWPLSDALRCRLRGHGFTLYGLLEEIPELIPYRYGWQADLGNYDLIVLAHVWQQGELLLEVRRLVDESRIAILD